MAFQDSMFFKLSRKWEDKMRYIENWQNKKLQCFFRGEMRSVKYEIEIYNPVISNDKTYVCACNKCALKNKKEE